MPAVGDDPSFMLPASTRYLGAWAEVNTRLSIRAQINSYHITSILAAIGAFFIIQDDSKYAVIARVIPALLMPIISTIFVLWYMHNDYILGLLSAFCGEFERQDAKPAGDKIPSWFFGAPATEIEGIKYGRLQIMALKQRELSDIATIIICFLSPVLVVYNLRINHSFWNWFFLLISIIWLFIASYFLWIIKKIRVRLLDTTYDSKLGLWKLTTNQGLTPIVFINSVIKKITGILKFSWRLFSRREK